MANPTSKLNLVINGVTTQLDIHDANAIPRSGGSVLSGTTFARNSDNGSLVISGGTASQNGARLELCGKDYTGYGGNIYLYASDDTTAKYLVLMPNGTALWNNKNLAMQEDVIPRSGGAVLSGTIMAKTTDDSHSTYCGGTSSDNGAFVRVHGKDYAEDSTYSGTVIIRAKNNSDATDLFLKPDGTATWGGQPIQTSSDQRLKQQINTIDDKLLDAWADVELSQFKYNDAVDEKGDKARLHTGYVVQQIDNACKKHGVDISAYGLYCHEQYPEETEEVEVEQADGTKTKERKVIREASEHYSLRYTEALIVECKYLRRCIARLTARIKELEKGNNTK